ncbi:MULTISPECIES: toll/interleukin-1 receptor domain-containing protein [Micrococcus]|uniref:toll/interleukin-1 receptor domain-containing protein n=1 Tax=Micrococcus TaxID=1269 RepID=UPI002117962F|nr:toll/interleukin-1 receptor domain-containing protein [Micrococcus luteus]
MESRPKVFVSHAGEDQPRFVEQFCRGLISRGIDAWFSGWEMKPGDSLVDKIFSGIDSSNAFVVVVSRYSYDKPWVREELETAVNRSVREGRAYRIIPVVIDKGVSVPTAVSTRLWVTAHLPEGEDSADPVSHAVREVVRALSDATEKPPLAPFIPSSIRVLEKNHDSVDDAVLFELATRFDETNRGEASLVLDAQTFAREIAQSDLAIEEEEVMESIYYLIDTHQVKGSLWAGGGAMITDVSSSAWETYAIKCGIDLRALEVRFLTYIVNDEYTHEKVVEDLPSLMLRTLVFENLKSRKLINGSMSMSGHFYSQGYRPLARRFLRSK